MKTTKKYLVSAYYEQGAMLVILKCAKINQSGKFSGLREPQAMRHGHR